MSIAKVEDERVDSCVQLDGEVMPKKERNELMIVFKWTASRRKKNKEKIGPMVVFDWMIGIDARLLNDCLVSKNGECLNNAWTERCGREREDVRRSKEKKLNR